MISSEALILGPLMLPWTLLVILAVVFISSWSAKRLQSRFHWANSTLDTFQNSIWTSLMIGFVVARCSFMGMHADAYLASPLEMIKIQDKGFDLWSGVIAGVLWFYLKNKWVLPRVRMSYIVILVACLSAHLALQQQFKSSQTYPNFVLAQIDSQQTVAFDKFKGKPTVINLWATWCPPCAREMPVLNSAVKNNPDIHFVMINQGEEQQVIQQYLDQHNYVFQHVLTDPQSRMLDQMQMFGLPSTLFFNAEGELVDRHMGELTSAVLQHYLEKISL